MLSLLIGRFLAFNRPPLAENHIVTVVTRVSPHLFLNDALDEEALGRKQVMRRGHYRAPMRDRPVRYRPDQVRSL
jgi:hypothetical protein